MTDELYRTPMAGNVLIYWSLGEDEGGVPEGFIGTPTNPDDMDAPLVECLGCDVAFATELPAFDDEALAVAIHKAAIYAVGKYVMPKLIRHFFDAAIELRERQGGFDQEKYDILQKRLIEEREAQRAEENQSDEG